MTTWLRSWSSPTWHEEARRDGELVYFLCGLSCSASSVAHEEPEPPRGSACKNCQRRAALKRRAALRVLPERRSGAKRSRDAQGLDSGESSALAFSGPMPPLAMRPWPGLLTAELAAAYCSVSRRQWDRLCARGAAPRPRVVGGSKRWALVDLDEWIEDGLPSRAGEGQA